MHKTTGDGALTNINRETKYFHDFVQYPHFISLKFVLSMLLNFGHFSASQSKKGSYIEKNVYVE